MSGEGAPARTSLRLSNPFDYEDVELAEQRPPRNSTPGAPSKYVELSATEAAAAAAPLEVCIDESDELHLIRFLHSGRVYGYPHTTGTRFSNYIRFVANNHPLLSICFVHSKNPYGVKQRVHVFFCVASLAILLNFVLLKTQYVHEVAICTAGCLRTSTTSDTTCSGGYNNGMEANEYLKRCALYSPSAVSALVGFILLPYGTFLRFVATCGCTQGRLFFIDHCVGKTLKAWIDYFGGILMVLFMTLSFIMTVVVVAFCGVKGDEVDNWSVFVAFSLSKLLSALQWFVWTAPLFLCRIDRDKAHFENSLARKSASASVAK